MTVQRQYTLPNCNLVIEGLSGGDEGDPVAPLTVVLNAEFTFPELAESLSGGREFLGALAGAVSDYAQSLLSGLPYPTAEAVTEQHPVMLQPGDRQRHQLTATVTDANGAAIRKTLSLNTVQLFDLMEAIDQLLADGQTLPDMTLHLSSLQRRHARPAEPLAQRVAPAAAGLSTLAAAAVLLFFLPVPEVEPEPSRDERATASEVETPSPDRTTDASAPPAADSDRGDAESDTEATVTIADPVSAATAIARLTTAPEITDPDTLARLETQLSETLTAALADPVPYDDRLVYRVAVSETGDVLGYKYENDAALTNADNTPLPRVTYIPANPEAPPDEPVAQFRVTFEPDGDVVVAPFSNDAD